MDTQVQTPQVIFNLPSRLLVPLFQRPYVWNEENQWEPLWGDVERIAEKLLQFDNKCGHFLGAVVLQEEPPKFGSLTAWSVIDGQQRLTTLQVMFRAILSRVTEIGFPAVARRLLDLVENPDHQRTNDEEQFKVWPTNRDRAAFEAVMRAQGVEDIPVDLRSSRIVKAFDFFSRRSQEWLMQDDQNLNQRANALVDGVATRLQIVVIGLKADEDAQEIFETLNARGTPLTAADLIKNLVFQRLDAEPLESERVYKELWQQFETEFWEKEVSSGRVLWSRSSLFLTQWLISQTRRDVTAREAFSAFKRYLADSDRDVLEILQHVKACADIYQDLIEKSRDHHAPLSTLEMFVYRSTELNSEIVKPVIIWFTDPELEPIPKEQLDRGIRALESWLVRRTLIREKSAGSNRFMVDLLAQLADEPRSEAGDRMEAILAEQTSDVSYWPDDETVTAELTDFPIYKRLGRGRLRMVLEAIEDKYRGFPSQKSMGDQPFVRVESTIEHVMPQRWGQNWPLPEDAVPSERDQAVQSLGNLTLTSVGLNSRLSNAGWRGEKGKKEGLRLHSSAKMTDVLIALADANDDEWTEALISERTQAMIDMILEIWPAPAGLSNMNRLAIDDTTNVSIADLIKLGHIKPGEILVGGRARFKHLEAVILPDGNIEFEGKVFETPSGAGKEATKLKAVNGWSFWKVGSETGPRLNAFRRQALGQDPSASLGPFNAEDYQEWWTQDIGALRELVIEATGELPIQGRLPWMQNKGQFQIARYWAFAEGEPNICVGVPISPPAGRTETPLWARYSHKTPKFDLARAFLQETIESVVVDDQSGDIWVPLGIDANLSGAELVSDIVEQIEQIDLVARGQYASDQVGGTDE